MAENSDNKITAEEFDRKFDNNEDISNYLDWKNSIISYPDKKDKLIQALEGYIKLLGEEISEMAPLLYVHGYISQRVMAGMIARAEIDQLKKEIYESI